MDGLINVYKPRGITSAKALYRVRRITGVRKSGHAGTLDPAAEGVLLICLGRATKLVERIMSLPKVYRATARLDVTSDSFDSDGALSLVEAAVPLPGRVAEMLSRFEGCIEQVPPAISAVKVRGEPAYKRARLGEAIELKPRPAVIYWLHVHRYDWPLLDFEVACGRGTYVRALIRDIGLALSTGGCLTSLQRSRVGPYTADQAWTLERLEQNAPAGEAIVPLAAIEESLQGRLESVIPPRPPQTECPSSADA